MYIVVLYVSLLIHIVCKCLVYVLRMYCASYVYFVKPVTGELSCNRLVQSMCYERSLLCSNLNKTQADCSTNLYSDLNWLRKAHSNTTATMFFCEMKLISLNRAPISLPLFNRCRLELSSELRLPPAEQDFWLSNTWVALCWCTSKKKMSDATWDTLRKLCLRCFWVLIATRRQLGQTGEVMRQQIVVISLEVRMQ